MWAYEICNAYIIIHVRMFMFSKESLIHVNLFLLLFAIPCHTISKYHINCHIMPCHSMPCHFMSCHAMPRHAMPHHAKPRHDTPRHATPRHATPRHAMSLHATPGHIMSCHAMPCHAMSRHVMSCPAMPCHAMPCPIMPCHIIPYIIYQVLLFSRYGFMKFAVHIYFTFMLTIFQGIFEMFYSCQRFPLIVCYITCHLSYHVIQCHFSPCHAMPCHDLFSRCMFMTFEMRNIKCFAER